MSPRWQTLLGRFHGGAAGQSQQGEQLQHGSCAQHHCSPNGQWSWVEPRFPHLAPSRTPREFPHIVTGLQASQEPQWWGRLLLTQWKIPLTAHSSWAFTSCQTQAWPALQVTLNLLQTTFLPLHGVSAEILGCDVDSRVTSHRPHQALLQNHPGRVPDVQAEPSWAETG